MVVTKPYHMTGTAGPFAGLGLRPKPFDGFGFAVCKNRVQNPSIPYLPRGRAHGNFIATLGHFLDRSCGKFLRAHDANYLMPTPGLAPIGRGQPNRPGPPGRVMQHSSTPTLGIVQRCRGSLMALWASVPENVEAWLIAERATVATGSPGLRCRFRAEAA